MWCKLESGDRIYTEKCKHKRMTVEQIQFEGIAAAAQNDVMISLGLRAVRVYPGFVQNGGRDATGPS